MKIRTGRIEKSRLAYLILSTLLTSQIPLRAEAQAMMEYGGLMAMPKAVPSAGTINTLTNPYRSINSKLMGTAPGATPAAGGNNSAMSVDALGTVTLDPKKAQLLGAKALKQFEQAKAKVAAHPADLKGAEVLMREAIDTRNSIWGYSDPVMPVMLNVMGEIYAKQKHVSEAEACFKNALVYITKKQGSGSFERVDTLANLGALYSDNNNPKEAVNYFQQVAQIRERQSGATSLTTLKARLQWANASAAAGRSDTGSLYQALVDSLSRADKTKSGYSEVQNSLVKSYGAFLKKEGRSAEVAGLETRFTTTAASDAIPEIVSTPVTTQTTNTLPAQTAIPATVMPVPVEKTKDQASAPATSVNTTVSAPAAEMTIEEKLRAQAESEGKLKKGKGKLEL